MTTTMNAPAIWKSTRVWTVEPLDTGGYSVLCDGQPVNWFRYFGRAVNEAKKCNCAEMLRIQRMREANA